MGNYVLLSDGRIERSDIRLSRLKETARTIAMQKSRTVAIARILGHYDSRGEYRK